MALNKNYSNSLIYNNGIHITGSGPIDDRIVVKSVESLYITVGQESNCMFYNRAYPGLLVSVFETDESISIYQLRNASPYLKGTVSNVDSTTISLYWSILNNKTINSMINDATYFNSNISDDMKMITSHGNLPKNTTVGQLKNMTISDILMNILFETATPVKTVSKSASISFKSPYNATVEVGTALPNNSSFNYSYTPEKWNWISKDRTSSGTEVSLSVFDNIKYYKSDTNNNENGTELTTISVGTAVEGINGYYYGVVTYDKGSDAVDSLEKTAPESGVKYAEAQSGTISTPTTIFTGAWYVYSNASKVSSSDLKAYKTTNPESFKGNNVKNSTGVFAKSGSVVYLQYPNGTTDSEYFYVYVPISHSIISCNRIADMTDDYNVSVFYEQEGTETISNTLGNTNGTFKKYKLLKRGGISTIKIVLS